MKKIFFIIVCLVITLSLNAQNDSIYRDISLLKKNIIKIKPTSFLFGYTQITYERSLSPRRSIEANVGLIGLGDDTYNRDPMGFALRGGYKFYFGSRKIKRSFMKGLYLMPEIAFCMYDKNVPIESDWDLFSGIIKKTNSVILDEEGEVDYERLRKYYIALIGTVGYQWNINRFVIEYNIGIGLGYYNKTRNYTGFFNEENDDQHHFGFYGGNDGRTYGVFNANLKIGYMF
jgi:hypothetical protein